MLNDFTSFASWKGHNDLFSRENLMERQPVLARFADELIRNPEKPERAAHVAREQSKVLLNSVNKADSEKPSS